MKKTILYTLAAVFTAAIAAIVIVGCNNGDGGDSAGLNDFLGGFINRDPGGGKFAVSVENGRSPGGGSYAAGEEVVIVTDKERDGQRFDGWTSSSAGVEIADPGAVITSFTMPPNAVTVKANFAPKTTFAVVYDANGGDNAPRDNGSPYDSGTTVTVLGPGDMTRSGHNFSGWSTQNDGGGDQFGGNDNFSITAAITLYAKWTPEGVKTYKVTVENGSGGSDYEAGKTVSISATIPPGQQFTNWTVNTNNVTLADATLPTTSFTMPPSNVTVTANFEEIPTYAVTVDSKGDGAIGAKNYAAGEIVSIYAGAPPTGQKFKNWTTESKGVAFASANSISTTFIMPANAVTVTANFESSAPTYYMLTTDVSPRGSGSVSLEPAQPNTGYAAGTTVNAKATAASGYTFTNWSNASSAKTATVMITMDGHKALTANFSQNTTTPTSYTLWVISNPADGGTVKVDYKDYTAPVTVNSGTAAAISATPAAGYAFTNWAVVNGSAKIENLNSASTTVSLGGNATISANFTQSTPTLQSCNQYCYWGKEGGCAELVVDPSGNYYSNPGAANPTPHPISSCDEAIKFCDIDGGGRYTNNSCTGTPVVSNPNEKCGVYCIWDDGVCNELITDKTAYYDWPVLTCEEAKNNCAAASRDRKTFATMAECKTSEFFGKPVLAKSATALRAVYSAGAVTATLTPPAAPKLSGGSAELIDDKTGAAVSSAAVSVSGRKATAVLPAGADVPAGYYTVRVVLRDKSGGEIVEEASIGIVK